MSDLISALEELRGEVPVLKMAEANKSPTRRLMESVDLFRELIDRKFRPSQVYAKVKDTDGIKEIRDASCMSDDAFKLHFASVYNAYKRDLRKKANKRLAVKVKPAPKVTAANIVHSETSASENQTSDASPTPTPVAVEPTPEVPALEAKTEKKSEFVVPTKSGYQVPRLDNL